MAQKVQVILVDDLDGGAAEETVQFGLDGVTYEIDLSVDNAAALRDTLAHYVGSSRRVGGRSRGGRRAAGAAAGGRAGATRDTAAVRAWAREQGFQVSDRGRIPGDILEKYDAAHG